MFCLIELDLFKTRYSDFSCFGCVRSSCYLEPCSFFQDLQAAHRKLAVLLVNH